MDSHAEKEVSRATDGLCKEKVSMYLAVDVPTNPDQDESVNYIP